MTKRKNHMGWSWVFIVAFFALSILDIRFGLLGLLCMGAPIFHALRGKGKIHCSSYCPRGSFLGKFMQYVTLNQGIPKWMNTKKFKHGLLIFMLIMFGLAMYHAGFAFQKVAFALFRFMGASFMVGILMGVLFKPRSWCQVCPMGHATGLIRDALKK